MICQLFLILLTHAAPFNGGSNVYLTQKGRIHFLSDAPLEIIQAKSDQLKAAIDPANNTFAFSVDVASFEGFNSPLQKVHFNENYLVSKRFPKGTFTGKIIEDVDLAKDGEYTIRAKGKLTFHGIAQERIIKSSVTIRGGVLSLRSSFTILLDEHGIDIPKVVHQKIAAEVAVEVEAVLTQGDTN